MAVNRKAMKEELLKRQQESYQTKDDSGRFKTVWRSGTNITMWKCGEARHAVDVIPFIAGKNHPNVAEGKPTYNIDFWQHTKIGVGEDNYICMAKTFGRQFRCPICEYQNELRKKLPLPEKEIKALNAKRRVAYNIWVHDNTTEEAKGVQIWEVFHGYFEKFVVEIAQGGARLRMGGGEPIPWTDPDEGKTVYFTRKGTTMEGTDFYGHVFEDRPEPIPDDILEQAKCLDDLIIWPTYEQVWEALHERPYERENGGEEPIPEASEEPPPERTRTRIPKEPPKEEEDDVPLDPEPKKEEKPKPSLKRPEQTAGEGECPHGLRFGIDVDSDPSKCNRCEKWEPCSDAADEMK